MKIDYARLVDMDKRRAFFAGRIHTLKEIVKHYRPFMSDEFATLLDVKLDELCQRKEVVKDQIREIVSPTVTDNLEQVDAEPEGSA